jgi:hypothetical protein
MAYTLQKSDFTREPPQQKGGYKLTPSDFTRGNGINHVSAMAKMSPSQRSSYFQNLNADDQKQALENMQGNTAFTPQELESYSNMMAGRPTTFLGRQAKSFERGAQDVAGGVVNPLLNVANLVLPHAHQIPQIPTRDSVPMHAGQLLGYTLPYEGAARGIDVGVNLARRFLPAAEKELSPLLQRIGTVARGVGAGSAAGAATAPSGERLPAGIFGAAGGGIGEGAAQALRGVVGGASKLGLPERIAQKVQTESPVSLNGEAGDNLVEDIGQHYTDAKNSVSPLYQNLFKGAKDQQRSIAPDDLQNYAKIITQDKSLNRAVPAAIRTPNEMPLYELPKDKVSLDPEQLHFEKSRYQTLARSAKDPEQRIAYGRYGDALGKDLNNILDKHGLKDDYANAATAFKQKLLPFNQSKVFTQQLKPYLDTHTTLDDEGNHFLNLGGVRDTAPTTKIAKRLVPTSTEKDMGKLNELTNLMAGNKAQAGIHARNVMFGDTILRDNKTGQSHLNVDALAAKAQKLSQPQRDFLFNPEEQRTIDALAETKKGRQPSRIRNIEELGTGAIIGHHLLPGFGTVAGLLAGIPVGEAGRRAIGQLLTRKMTLPQLTEKVLSPATVRPSRIAGPAASYLGAQFGQRVAGG